jgi:iron complex transport system substrate-binding protein
MVPTSPGPSLPKWKEKWKMKKVLKRIISLLAAILMAAAVLPGCSRGGSSIPGGKTAGAFPVTITDVYGSQITLEKEPQRIVALAPSIVEVLYKLGLGDRIVGVTEYCDYPEEAKSKPIVGDFNSINTEKIIEAKPDLVLGGAGMSKETFKSLTDLKLNVMVAEARTLAQIPETFVMIGKAAGREQEARKLADGINSSMDEFRKKVQGAEKVKVYFVMSFGKQGNWTAGKGTFISDLVNLAGGENISDDVDSWNDYSLEKIIEKNPDILLVSNMVAGGSTDVLDNEKGYSMTNAVKNNKLFILDDNLVQRPGPRIVEGLEIIAKAIHPEIFGK